MANPSNRGIGTGTAQIFDTSNVDNAINRLADIKFRKDAINAQGRAKAEEEKAGAVAELQGQFKDYDTNKLMLADVPEFQLKVQNINKKYDGNWGKILKGDPALANQYRSDIDEVKRFIARSVDSKPKAQAHLKQIEGNPLYSDEYKASYVERATSPNYNFDEDSRNGNLARDVARPDFMNNISGLFVGDGNELYDKKQVSYTGKDGKVYAEESKVWKPEEDAFAKFKTTIGSDIETMTDINLQYRDLPEEDRIKAAYDDYKQSSEVYQKDITSKAAPEDDSKSGFGFGNGKFNFALRSIPVRGEGKGKRGDVDVITIGKTSGGPLSPITVNGKTGVVSEISKGRDGKWIVTRAITKESISGDITLTGETVTEPINSTMSSHLESTYGVSDIDELSNQ